jgi:hypothetical protein
LVSDAVVFMSPLIGQAPLDCCHQLAGYIGIVGRINLADAGRAGDIDFCEVVADHIKSDEYQATLDQRRTYLAGDPAITLRQRLRASRATGGEIATGFALGGQARQAIGIASPSIIRIRLSPSRISGK